MTYKIIELILDPDQGIPLELKEWEVVSQENDGEEVSYVLGKANN